MWGRFDKTWTGLRDMSTWLRHWLNSESASKANQQTVGTTNSSGRATHHALSFSLRELFFSFLFFSRPPSSKQPGPMWGNVTLFTESHCLAHRPSLQKPLSQSGSAKFFHGTIKAKTHNARKTDERRVFYFFLLLLLPFSFISLTLRERKKIPPCGQKHPLSSSQRS